MTSFKELEAEIMEAFPGCPRGRDLVRVWVPYATWEFAMAGRERSALSFLGVPVIPHQSLAFKHIVFEFAAKVDPTPTEVLVQHAVAVMQLNRNIADLKADRALFADTLREIGKMIAKVVGR